MAKDLRLDVITTEDGKGLRAAADDLDKLAGKTDTAASKTKGLTQESSKLDAEIARVRQRTRELGQEFEQTGNKDVFKSLKQNINYGTQLEKVRTDLKKTFALIEQDAGVTGTRSGQGFFRNLINLVSNPGALATNLSNKFADTFSKDVEGGLGSALGSPAVWAVAAPAVAAGAATLGVMAGGAILTGIGLAGIGGGIAGQIHNPLVVAAATTLGHDVSSGFNNATSSFALPTARAIANLDAEWKKLQPDLKATFTQLAPLVDKLGAGVAGFVDRLAPGLEKAAVAAAPLVQEFSQWLPQLGSNLGALFDTMGQNADSARQGLLLTEHTISDILVVTRDAIPVMSKLFDATKATTGTIALLVGDTRVSEFHKGFETAADGANLLATAESRAAAEADALNQSIANLFNQTMNVAQADLQWHKDLTTLVTDIDKHGKSLDINTAAGQKNIGVLEKLAQDAERTREANIAAAGGQNASAAAVDAANKKYSAQMTQLEALAIKLGLSKDKVHQLLDQWAQLAKAPDIFKSITITTNQRTGAGYTQTAGGKALLPNAEGGPVRAGDALLVGEHRPEVFVPKRDGFILPEVPRTGYGRALPEVGGAPMVTRVLQPIQLVTPGGKILWETQIEYALDTGRTPAALWPDHR